jgi:Zn-dependent membrane protease YugP
VFVVFAVGMWCSDGHAVDRQIASVWWIGQALFGGGALFASLVTAPIEMTSSPDNLELGTNLCTVAGLMNLVVMIDAFTVAERSSFPVSSMPAEGGAA